MARFGIGIPELSNYGFGLLRSMTQGGPVVPDPKTQ
jgi:hypothetical protein